MKIALAVCMENPCPPVGYGGAERVADTMCRSLKELGHEVHLYCGEGSTCKYADKLIMFPNTMSSEIELNSKLAEDTYDCIIDYTAHHLVSMDFDNVWSLMGGDPFKRYRHDEVKNRVYPSREFADFNGQYNHPILPHALYPLVDDVPFYPNAKDHFVYIGGIHPMKGTAMVIDVCLKAGVKLDIYGSIKDHKYYTMLQNLLTNENINYKGELKDEGRDDAFGEAKALLHFPLVCDADPGTAREAMSYGTPVIATPMGGVHSTVIPYKTGLFIGNCKKGRKVFNGNDYNDIVDDACFILKEVDKLSRSVVRETIKEVRDHETYKFNLNTLCERIKKGESW